MRLVYKQYPFYGGDAMRFLLGRWYLWFRFRSAIYTWRLV